MRTLYIRLPTLLSEIMVKPLYGIRYHRPGCETETPVHTRKEAETMEDKKLLVHRSLRLEPRIMGLERFSSL
jgi:hypothetical protein